MRTIRTYTSSAEALGDIAMLESHGIASAFKGAVQADAHMTVVGTVELQVREDDYAVASGLLTSAEKARVDRYIPARKKGKTPARYFKIGLIAFVPMLALVALKLPMWSAGPIGYFIVLLLAGGVAGMIGLFCALLDL